jgi:pectinesterase
MKFKFPILLSLFITTSLLAQQEVSDLGWDQVVYDLPAEWYGSGEAVRIADNVLLYQRNIGGWPKNIPMHHVLSEKEKKKLLKLQSTGEGATTDNGATVMELIYLSRVYGATGKNAYKAAFLKGIDYLIEDQYPNGGWPQFYPLRGGYYDHITFNDNSMVNIMRVMRAIAQKSDTFSIVADEQTAIKAQLAYDKGIKVILESQYRQEGVLTVWCAQHDEVTLEPAQARTYELPSLSGAESAGIVLLLMEMKNPTPEVVNAIQSAVRWFEKVKIQGLRVESYRTEDGERDRRVVPDQGAPALWARFYGLTDNRPFFCDRDGIKKYSLAEIGYERRNNYSWYTRAPQEVLDAYCEWQSMWVPVNQ